MKDLTQPSAMAWYHGRKAAGDSYTQMESILTQASKKCPGTIKSQIMTIAEQMAHDSMSSLISSTRTPGGHR
jgi:hypothetical protein